MRTLDKTEQTLISGAKTAGDYYQDIIKPAIFVGATVVGGTGGQIAARLVVHGIEGLIEVLPSAIKALEDMNRLTDAELQDRMDNPYRYPD